MSVRVTSQKESKTTSENVVGPIYIYKLVYSELLVHSRNELASGGIPSILGQNMDAKNDESSAGMDYNAKNPTLGNQTE